MKSKCIHCNESLDIKWIDEGIGPYEYWGYKCTDTHMVSVCSSCGNEVESPITYQQYIQNEKEDYLANAMDL